MECLRLRYDQGVGLDAIASELGVQRDTVKRRLRAMGLPTNRARGMEHVDVDELAALTASGLRRSELAEYFKVSVGIIDRIRRRAKHDGREIAYAEYRGEKHHRWRGGRHKNPHGYWKVRVHDHPHAAPNGYVLEHRLVMEKAIGRCLERGEVVHHKNGRRDDNRLENLELCLKGALAHPPGQRVEDVVEWSAKMLARYAPEKLV